MKKSHIAMPAIMLVALINLSLPAQEASPAPAPEPSPVVKPIQPPRILGSQTFEIDLGLMVPLFTADDAGNVTPSGNIGLGGAGRLKWAAFVNQYLSFGVDVSGAINAGPNTLTNLNTLGLVNIAPHVTGNIRFGNFQMPISLAPAFSIMTYANATYLGFAIRPGVGLYYDVTPNWSFGLNLNYWWVPELYAGPTPPTSQNRFGNFLEISISALYSF